MAAQATVQPATPAIAAFPWEALLIGVALIVLAVFVIRFLKNFLANAVFGVLMLAVLDLVATYGNYPSIKVPITFLTVVISALLGLAGVGLLILLKLLGIVIA